MTAEDVIPLWLRREYLAVHLGQGNLPPKTILDLCPDCNRDLGRIFEDSAAPLLKKIMWGQGGALTPEEQVVVARWFAKTDAMLAIFRNTTGDATKYTLLDQEEIDALRALISEMRQRPGVPANSFVRVGRIDPTFRPVFDRPYRSVELPYGHPWVHSVLPVGFLVGESLLNGNRATVPFTDSWHLDDRFVVMWPPQKTLWPPRGRLPNEASLSLMAENNHKPSNRVGGGFTYGVSPVDGSVLMLK